MLKLNYLAMHFSKFDAEFPRTALWTTELVKNVYSLLTL